MRGIGRSISGWDMKLSAMSAQNPSGNAPGRITTHFVILSSILRGSRMKVGKTTRLRSAPGRSCEMMCERTERVISVLSGFAIIEACWIVLLTIALVGLHDLGVILDIAASSVVGGGPGTCGLRKPVG